MIRKNAVLLLMMLAVWTSLGFAQTELTGLGLSGSGSSRDTVAMYGDTIHVLTTFTSDPGWVVTQPALSRDSSGYVRIQYFSDSLGEGSLLDTRTAAVIASSVAIDTIAIPHRLTFRLKLTSLLNPRYRSLQIQMALLAHDGNDTLFVSPPHTSHVTVGLATALDNPVDDSHSTLLRTQFFQADLIGIGLSGNVLTRDTVVVDRDTVHVIASYLSERGWTVTGTGLLRDSLGYLRAYFYADTLARGGILEIRTLPIVPNSLVIDSSTYPFRMKFKLLLGNVINPRIKSLQIEMAVAAENSTGDIYVSAPHTSRSQISRTTSLENPVDFRHATYLRFLDNRTYPIEFLSPASGSVVGGRISILYSQAEDALARSLQISISTPTENLRILYLHDTRGSTDKRLTLNAFALVDGSQVDSMTGPASLTNGLSYRFVISYQDINRNTATTDTLYSLLTDLQTQRPTLYEPRSGSSSATNMIHFLYNLPERADTVWVTFTLDTASAVEDSMSPHILTLIPQWNGPGLVQFDLNGQNIGTDNPFVLQSNRGSEDTLITGGIYRVTLSYGDTVGNLNASVSNENYVWPRDLVTLAPNIISPQDSARVSETIHFEFSLPETPAPGTVILRLAAQSTQDPGSPHLIYFLVNSPGVTGLMLNAANLRFSVGVDTVTGPGSLIENNRLVNGIRYFATLTYRDTLRNPEGRDLVRFTYDNQTDPPVINNLQDGATLPRSDLLIDYNQPETALPGSLKAILTQIGGPDVDLGSPHTLYLSSLAALNHKELRIQPASLGASGPIDSISGGQSLLPRAYYRLTLQYRDTLGNPAGVVQIDSLLYPSGASVFISGNTVGSGFVVPGDTASVVFRLKMTTDGGESVLRAFSFGTQGDATVHDLTTRRTKLWKSADSSFTPDDRLVNNLNGWNGGTMEFDSFAVALGVSPIYFFVTLDFQTTANPAHQISLILNSAEDVDCGGDPISAQRWPIGNPDVPLAVELLTFTTTQDSSIGALKLQWTVASEFNNAGFRVQRKTAADTVFQNVASYTSDPNLSGQGTSPVAHSYEYTDHGLTPGQRYIYRLQAVSFNFEVIDLTLEAEGIPRIPPSNYELGDAFPNPFNQQVNIVYFVPVASRVELTVYDLLGREVRQIVKAIQPAAEYHVQWDGRNDQGIPVPSGIYFYRLTGGGRFDVTKKLLLTK